MITLDSSYKQRTLVFLMLCFIPLIAFSCDDENESQCNTDQNCTRGQLCISSACSIVTCENISQCPGTGRTCLSDLNQCSAKECGDELNGVSLQCDAGLVCNLSGSYLYSCSPVNGPTACTMDIDCTMASEGTSCCNGSCASMCDTPIIPMDMGTGGDTPPVDMMIPMPTAVNLCTPCTNEAICAGLGEGAKCTAIGEGNFCTSACGDDTDCPTGFNCFSTLGQCIPSNFECAACQQTPCEAGQFCNINSGECGPPQDLCGNCSEDAACADGRVCRTIGMNPTCVQACDTVNCPADMTCTDGGCIPNSGVCDPCAGTCSGGTPYCIEEEARCAECGPTSPCAEGLRCDLMTYMCTDALPNGMCVVDTDCQGGGLCFNGTCVECFQDGDCPARNTCNTDSFTCEYSACGGVECQTGSTCDASSGRCAPGCNTNTDCVLPDVMDCNAATGQCYYIDGSCELGGDAVCAPGGQCMPNIFSFLDPTLPAQCTCAKEDPTDPLSADRIPCHTGQTCTDFSSILGDLGLEFDATCGEGLF